jgi:RNA polymerase sigma factor (sigma-70 family)
MPSRNDQVAAFYAKEAAGLLRAVRHAITGPGQLIEDACSFAWTQLLLNDQVQLDAAGFGWLYTVAKREAYLLTAKARREPPLGDPHGFPGIDTAQADAADVIFERLEAARERHALVRALSPRMRALVLLHAAGFSYREIAQLTGDTLRTVERQLLRGKRALRREAARSMSNSMSETR